MIPSTIKIGALIFDVVKDKKLMAARDKFGEYNGIEQEIRIDSGVSVERQEMVLLHEIIEGINVLHELEMEHHQITTLAACLHEILKENKLWF